MDERPDPAARQARPVGPAGSQHGWPPHGRGQGWWESGSRTEWSTWAWQAPRSPVPILGLVLVLVGGALLLEALIPGLSLTTLVLLAIGGGLTAAAVLGNVRGATVPGLVILGWSLARLGAELDLLDGDGTVPAFVGLGLIVAWWLGRAQGVAREWALWLGLGLTVLGLADALDLVPEALSVEVVVPVAVILLGAWIIVRGRRGSGPPVA